MPAREHNYLIGVATNVQEALALVRSYLQVNHLEEYATKIATGANTGRNANYNRVLQSIKSEDAVKLSCPNRLFLLQNIFTNKFIIPKSLKANEKRTS